MVKGGQIKYSREMGGEHGQRERAAKMRKGDRREKKRKMERTE